MIGYEQGERFRRGCLKVIDRMKRQEGDAFRWHDVYEHRSANELVDEALAAMALTFEDYERRVMWLLLTINAQLVAAEAYAFEGSSVDMWKLDRDGLVALLSALYGRLAKRANRIRPQGHRTPVRSQGGGRGRAHPDAA